MVGRQAFPVWNGSRFKGTYLIYSRTQDAKWQIQVYSWWLASWWGVDWYSYGQFLLVVFNLSGLIRYLGSWGRNTQASSQRFFQEVIDAFDFCGPCYDMLISSMFFLFWNSLNPSIGVHYPIEGFTKTHRWTWHTLTFTFLNMKKLSYPKRTVFFSTFMNHW